MIKWQVILYVSLKKKYFYMCVSKYILFVVVSI